MKNSSIIKKMLSTAKVLTAFALIFCFTALPLMASSHREAPLISMDPAADNTDVYAFRSMETGREGYVTLIANYIPFQDPSGGPQFYRFDDSVQYEINVDNNGDGLPEISYQFRFQTHIVNGNTILGMSAFNNGGSTNGVIESVTDPDYNTYQVYSVTLHNHKTGTDTVLASNVRMPPSNIGPKVTPNYVQNLSGPSVHTINANGTRIFAGQRDEGFLVDVGGVFDGLNLRSLNSSCGGVSSTDGYNVNSIAIEVPIAALTAGGTVPASPTASNAVIGVWATANRPSTRVINANGTRTFTGNFVQVSRLGNPLVNEVVIPQGLKDSFNSIRPSVDGTIPQVVSAITDPELAKLLRAVGAVQHLPASPRNDLVQIFATGIPVNNVTGPNYTTYLSDGVPHEMLRLNVGIAPTSFANANRLGLLGNDVAGFPNGRRVIDDVVDIELRAVVGGTPFTPGTNIAPNNTLGDGVSGNDVRIDPITGVNVSSGGYDYLQRFPYLAPPQPGNMPKVSNFRPCASAS